LIEEIEQGSGLSKSGGFSEAEWGGLSKCLAISSNWLRYIIFLRDAERKWRWTAVIFELYIYTYPHAVKELLWE
jgi:hypothetical protein